MRRTIVVVAAACVGLPACATESAGTGDESGEGCRDDAPGSRTISCVQSFSPGEGAGHGQDDYPDIVYGEPKGMGVHYGSLDVLTLGKGGSIVVGFGGGAIADGPGPDFIVFENALYKGDNPDYPFAEPGEVSVSDDGEHWATFPCHGEAFPYTGCAGWHAVFAGFEPGVSAFDPEAAGGEAYDLADVGVARARFVRVVDLSHAGTGGTAGFDLDAMTVVNPLAE